MRYAALLLLCGCGLQARTCAAQTSPIPGVESHRPIQANVGEPHVGRVLPSLYLRRFTPPEYYERWYHAMERCVGAKGNYRDIEWLVVPAPWLEGQRKTYGSWTGGEGKRNRITLNLEDWRDSALVSHEALHDILWRSGWRRPPLPRTAIDSDSIMASHPQPPFGRCAPTYFVDRP